MPYKTVLVHCNDKSRIARNARRSLPGGGTTDYAVEIFLRYRH